jgi:hypothetical protein
MTRTPSSADSYSSWSRRSCRSAPGSGQAPRDTPDRSGLRGRALKAAGLKQRRRGAGLHFSQTSVYWHCAFKQEDCRRSRVRPELWSRKTGECGSPNLVHETLLREEVKRSPLSDHCSCPPQRVTQRFSLTPSCGPATIRGCIHIRDRKAGTYWRESSAWRLPRAPTVLGPEEP